MNTNLVKDNATIQPNVVSETVYKEAFIEFRSMPTWRKLQVLMDLKDFELTFGYASGKIEISREEYDLALENFEKLGLVRKTEGSFEVVVTEFRIPTISDKSDRELQLDSHGSFMDELSGTLSVERKSRWANGFIASNDELISELKNKVLELFVEYDKKSQDSGEIDGVYGIGFTATDIIAPKGGK